jgi:hypothetical protein
MLEVEHFKRIDDSFGHPFGDRAADNRRVGGGDLPSQRRVACRFTGCCSTDTAGEGAINAAGRLRTPRWRSRTKVGKVTASFGVMSTGWMSERPVGDQPGRSAREVRGRVRGPRSRLWRCVTKQHAPCRRRRQGAYATVRSGQDGISMQQPVRQYGVSGGHGVAASQAGAPSH